MFPVIVNFKTREEAIDYQRHVEAARDMEWWAALPQSTRDAAERVYDAVTVRLCGNPLDSIRAAREGRAA